MEPDLAGFADAQRRLRAEFGEPVVFLAPIEESWPEGTPLDPQTNRPYDPLASGASGTAGSGIVVNCTVATRPFQKQDVEFGALGPEERDHIFLAADLENSGVIEEAERFVCRGTSYRKTSARPDGLGGVQRYLAFGREG